MILSSAGGFAASRRIRFLVACLMTLWDGDVFAVLVCIIVGGGAMHARPRESPDVEHSELFD